MGILKGSDDQEIIDHTQLSNKKNLSTYIRLATFAELNTLHGRRVGQIAQTYSTGGGDLGIDWRQHFYHGNTGRLIAYYCRACKEYVTWEEPKPDHDECVYCGDALDGKIGRKP